MSAWHRCEACSAELGRSFDLGRCSKCGVKVSEKQKQTLTYYRRTIKAPLVRIAIPAFLLLNLFLGVFLFADSETLTVLALVSTIGIAFIAISKAASLATRTLKESQEYYEQIP